jgi:hypothetical protein
MAEMVVFLVVKVQVMRAGREAMAGIVGVA